MTETSSSKGEVPLRWPPYRVITKRFITALPVLSVAGEIMITSDPSFCPPLGCGTRQATKLDDNRNWVPVRLNFIPSSWAATNHVGLKPVIT